MDPRALILLAALLAFAACGSDNSTSQAGGQADAPEGYAIESDEDRTALTYGSGERTIRIESGRGTRLLLREGFTLYPDAQVLAATVMQGGSGQGLIVTMRSSASLDELTSHYAGEAQAAGVSMEASMATPGTRLLSGRFADGQLFSFSAEAADGVTRAQLAILPQ